MGVLTLEVPPATGDDGRCRRTGDARSRTHVAIGLFHDVVHSGYRQVLHKRDTVLVHREQTHAPARRRPWPHGSGRPLGAPREEDDQLAQARISVNAFARPTTVRSGVTCSRNSSTLPRTRCGS
jgi:hypothetical protein